MSFLVPDIHFIRLPLLLIFIPLLLFSLKRLTAQLSDDDVPREVGIRREHRRAVRTKSDAVFDLDDDAGHYAPGNARLVDVSVWGACVSSNLSLRKGQLIRGRIHSPTEGLLEVSGEVVWVRKRAVDSLYGIGFTKITRRPNSQDEHDGKSL